MAPSPGAANDGSLSPLFVAGCSVARIEVTTQGLDIRYVTANITGGGVRWLYDNLYCARSG
jgi:hypothetical protein